ncbi:hypothetical protein JCM8097_001263 [Rhodosporidiobolus ruineniae]
MPGPPPSFSSFPESAKPVKPAPAPSFASFPSPPRLSTRRNDSPPPPKRARAADFLDQLGGELGIEKSDRRDRAREDRRKERERDEGHRSSRTDRDDRDERRHDSRSKGKERESEKGRDRDEGRRHRSSREKDEDRHHRSSRDKDKRRMDDDKDERRRREKGKQRESKPEKERDYGPSTGKSYKLLPELSSSALDHPPAPSPAEPASSSSTEKPLFYSSRKGDLQNLQYGGIHRGDVPRYTRFGMGKVVGLNEGLRITRETAYSGRGVEIAPIHRFRTPRYVDSSSYRHLTNRNSKRLVLAPRCQPQALGEKPASPTSVDDDEPEADFLALPRELSTSDKLAQLEHEGGTDYRSVSGLVKPSDLAGAGSDAETDDSDSGDFNRLGISGGTSHADRLREKNLSLDRALRDDPRNVPLWLEFVAFQDEVAQQSFSGALSSAAAKRALSKAERASTSEIKLSILERALAVPGNESSEKLILAQLEAAAEVETPRQVLERWQNALQDHPEMTGLWISYVSHRQTEWATFEVGQVVGVSEESLGVLSLAMDREEIGSSAREALEGNAIYLFLRLTLMLRQAGYSERAFAAFQALIELNLFRPPALASPGPYDRPIAWRDRLLDEFEAFWDTEAPRIGEPGAKGWGSATEDDLPPESSSSSSNALASIPTSDPQARPHERWAAAERLSAQSSLPARTTDPGIEDSNDPYRVVLFSDIASFLFVLHSPDSKLQLAYAFLTFLGLPFVPPDYPTSTPFTTDSFIHSELVERPGRIQRFWPKLDHEGAEKKPYETVGGEAMEPERRGAMGEPWDAPFAATPAAVDLLFGGGAGKGGWFRTLRKEDLADVELEVARNTFTLLRFAVSDTFLTLDFFAFEAAQSPKSAVKLAKQVLRDRRQDLALWDAYARIERQRGKVADARQVYVTALSMYRSFAERDQVDGPLLWRAWAEMEWEEGKAEVALRVLVAASGDSQTDLASLATETTRPPPAQLLRARQYYSHSLEAAFQPRATQAHLRNRNHLAFSSALLEYLAQSLDAAVEVLETHLFRLEVAGVNGSAEHEEALMMYAKLLYRHSAQGGAYRPTQLRDLLERALKAFKDNSLFLSLFYHNELRMKIQNRFRRSMEELVLKETEATSEGWLFAIFAELHLNSRNVNVWAVRNLFDRALDNSKTRSSPSLWVLYVDFEVKNGELQRAKSLIYRALRECPWVKELYLRPFSPTLRSVYRSRELRDFHHLLLEKGLRVRVEIDPFLDGFVSSDAEEERIEAGGEDVEMVGEAGEELLAERQRLMPY